MLVAQRDEFFERRRRWVGDPVTVQKLVAGPTTGDEVDDVLDPFARPAETLDGLTGYDMVDREVEPRLVALPELASAVDTCRAALGEDRWPVPVAARTITPRWTAK
jgi:hypothetical protein